MKLKKTLTTALTGAALFGATANAEIVLSDELSLYGYLDVAHSDLIDGDVESEQSVAEFELGFNFVAPEDPFFATMELSFTNDDAVDDELDFETAVIGYNYSDELVLTVGNILSYQGWETYDATGLYQFSYAYRDFTPLYAAYAVGAAADYVTEDYALGVWVGDSDDYSGASYEFLAAYTGVEGLTIKGIYADDPGYKTYNLWASYEYEGFTFAAEYIVNEYEKIGFGDTEESTGYLFMINYAWEKAGLTVRYSTQEDDLKGGGSLDDWEAFTISPSYMLSDKAMVLAEISTFDDGTVEDELYAIEFLYSF